MNSSLIALHTKLTWQLDELTLHLHEAENETAQLVKQLEELNQQVNTTSNNSLFINPEIEINKLNFLTLQQNKKEELTTRLKNQQQLENTLKEKIKRIKTELKMLEDYMDRELKNQQKLQKTRNDNALDEWVIQKRSVQ